MSLFRTVILLTPVVALSACTTTGTSNGTPGTDFETYTEYDALGQAIFDDTTGLRFTNPASLPRSGSSTYDGVIAVTVGDGTPDELEVIGALELTVLFGSDDISGSVRNVVDEFDDEYRGTLTIDNGELDRGAVFPDFTYLADMNGTLVGPGNEDFVVDGIIGGDLLGTDRSHTEGAVGGFVTTNEGASAITGAFIAELR